MRLKLSETVLSEACLFQDIHFFAWKMKPFPLQCEDISISLSAAVVPVTLMNDK